MSPALQDNGVAATIKHFVGNESEIERTTISSEVDERTLRELYLLPFEWAVRKAGIWAIMSSYNRLNGTYTSEDSWLLQQVLRNEWQFTGVVMSDWFGSHSTAPTVNAGLDLEMPGPTRDRGAQLVAAVAAGAVLPATVRARVVNVLRLMERTGALDDHGPHAERADDRPEHRALIRRAGAEAAVLLRNDGVLPLAAAGRIAVIGPNAKVAQIMGGGSAQLNPHYRVSPWDGLVAALGEDRLAYAPGARNDRFEPVLRGAYSIDFYASDDFSGPVVHTESLSETQAFWIGRVADGKVDPLHFSARISGRFVPEASGEHRAGIYSAGYCRLFVDGGWWPTPRRRLAEGAHLFRGRVRRGGRHRPPRGRAGPRGDHRVRHQALRDAGPRRLLRRHRAAARRRGDRRGCGTGPRRRGGLGLCRAQWRVGHRGIGSAAHPLAGPAERPHRRGGRGQPAHRRGAADRRPGGNALARAASPPCSQAWYPGQEAGNAIADVLTGRAEPVRPPAAELSGASGG
jgi:beta-glucosidase